ncbi:MAG: hypothetical protein V3T58_06680 [Candidatus Hydrothermarchaeales archaeon]
MGYKLKEIREISSSNKPLVPLGIILIEKDVEVGERKGEGKGEGKLNRQVRIRGTLKIVLALAMLLSLFSFGEGVYAAPTVESRGPGGYGWQHVYEGAELAKREIGSGEINV